MASSPFGHNHTRDFLLDVALLGRWRPEIYNQYALVSGISILMKRGNDGRSVMRFRNREDLYHISMHETCIYSDFDLLHTLYEWRFSDPFARSQNILL